MASCITSITSILLILVAPACGSLYAQGWSEPFNSFWSIDSIDLGTLTFGSTTVTPDTDTHFSISIAYDCTSGKMYSSVSANELGGPYYLVEVDPLSGTQIATPLVLDERISGLEFVNGQLYGWSSGIPPNSRGLVKINTVSGEITGVSEGVSIDTIVGMAYDVCTGTMYGVTYGGLALSGSNLVTINLETGIPTIVVDDDNAFNTGINWIDDIAFDDDCELYGVTAWEHKGQLISINLEDIDNPKDLGYFDALDGSESFGEGYVTGLVNVRDDCDCDCSPTPTASPTIAPTIPTASPSYSADGDDDDDDDDDDDSSSY